MLQAVQEILQESRQTANPLFSTADFSEFGWGQTDLELITNAIRNASVNI
jgi:hypothetical protein